MTTRQDFIALAATGSTAERREASRSEADRSGAVDPVGTVATVPDPEVSAVAKRRTFTAEYKRRILQEIDAATRPGEIGAILRREGLYSSTLASWRREREAALKQAFSKLRGPKAKKDALAVENEKLCRQNQRLQEELRKAELIIEVQKKVARLLNRPGSGTQNEDQ